MICGSDGILAKPTNDNGKIANGSDWNVGERMGFRAAEMSTIRFWRSAGAAMSGDRGSSNCAGKVLVTWTLLQFSAGKKSLLC
jgi:hypothetical protein